MAQCSDCGKQTSWLSLREGLYCAECFKTRADVQTKQLLDEADGKHVRNQEAEKIILTTETAHNLPVDKRLDIVTAECVIGMHIFKDVAAAMRDVFGGRSEALQKGLREARNTALAELRCEALELGADAVVGVDLDYSEITCSGSFSATIRSSSTRFDFSSPRGPNSTAW